MVLQSLIQVCIHASLVLLNLHRKLAGLSLVVPLLDPVNRTQRSERLEENLAWLKVFTLHSHTLVIIHVILGTVLGLVGVRESRVELRSLELEVVCVDSHGSSLVFFVFGLTILVLRNGLCPLADARLCAGAQVVLLNLFRHFYIACNCVDICMDVVQRRSQYSPDTFAPFFSLNFFYLWSILLWCTGLFMPPLCHCHSVH